MPKATTEPHERDHEDEELRVFTREQLDVIIKTSRQPLLLEFLACTGLRISEALALEWRHLELNGSDPHVKVRRGIVKGTLGPPKSKNGRRNVPLPLSLVRALREAHSALHGHATHEGWLAGRESALVFPSKTGTYLDPNSLRRDMLQPVCEEAGCSWATGFHVFRHTFASMHIAQGTNLVALSRVMGHHSAAFTLRVYGHLIEGEEAPALDLDASGLAVHAKEIWKERV